MTLNDLSNLTISELDTVQIFDLMYGYETVWAGPDAGSIAANGTVLYASAVDIYAGQIPQGWGP